MSLTEQELTVISVLIAVNQVCTQTLLTSGTAKSLPQCETQLHNWNHLSLCIRIGEEEKKHKGK